MAISIFNKNLPSAGIIRTACEKAGLKINEDFFFLPSFADIDELSEEDLEIFQALSEQSQKLFSSKINVFGFSEDECKIFKKNGLSYNLNYEYSYLHNVINFKRFPEDEHQFKKFELMCVVLDKMSRSAEGGSHASLFRLYFSNALSASEITYMLAQYRLSKGLSTPEEELYLSELNRFTFNYKGYYGKERCGSFFYCDSKKANLAALIANVCACGFENVFINVDNEKTIVINTNDHDLVQDRLITNFLKKFPDSKTNNETVNKLKEQLDKAQPSLKFEDIDIKIVDYSDKQFEYILSGVNSHVPFEFNGLSLKELINKVLLKDIDNVIDKIKQISKETPDEISGTKGIKKIIDDNLNETMQNVFMNGLKEYVPNYSFPDNVTNALFDYYKKEIIDAVFKKILDITKTNSPNLFIISNCDPNSEKIIDSLIKNGYINGIDFIVTEKNTLQAFLLDTNIKEFEYLLQDKEVCFCGFRNYFLPYEQKRHDYKVYDEFNLYEIPWSKLYTLDTLTESKKLDKLNQIIQDKTKIKEYASSISPIVNNGDKVFILSENDPETALITKILKRRGFIENNNLFIINPNDKERIESIKRLFPKDNVHTVGLFDQSNVHTSIETEPDASNSRGTKIEKICYMAKKGKIYFPYGLSEEEEKEVVAISEKLISDIYESELNKTTEQKEIVSDMEKVFSGAKEEIEIAGKTKKEVEEDIVGQIKELYVKLMETNPDPKVLAGLFSEMMNGMANEMVNKSEISNEQKEEK